MPDTKKTEEPVVKTVATPTVAPATPPDDTPKTTRVPADQPAEKVATPTVAEVKSSNNTVGTKAGAEADKNIAAKVEATADSVKAANESHEAVAKAEPFVKPEVKTVPAPTPDQAIAEKVEATAKSVAAFNKSAQEEKKSTAEITDETKIKPEVSRVAPLTGELRPDPADDSFVTPGRVPLPPDPKPGEPPVEVEKPPLVISPLTGEIKPADEISFPTPGHGRDTGAAHDALDKHGKTFVIDTDKTKFGVPEGHQVSLLASNEEAWKNDAAAREDQSTRAAMLAEMFVSTDNLRRQKRYQKNLR